MTEKKEKSIFVKALLLLWYCLTHPLVWLWRKLSGFFMRLNYRQIGKKIVRITGNFFHWLLFSVLIPRKYRNITKRDIYRIIFKADTPAGKRFDVWLLVLIGLNLVVIMLDSFDAVHANIRWVLKGLEWLLTIIFTLEYYLRIYCLNRPWKYVFSFYGIIDFLSIFPAYLSLLIPATQTLTVLRMLRTLRIFRIFNMQRFLQESFRLLNAIRRSVTKILIFMLFVSLYVRVGQEPGDVEYPEGYLLGCGDDNDGGLRRHIAGDADGPVHIDDSDATGLLYHRRAYGHCCRRDDKRV